MDFLRQGVQKLEHYRQTDRHRDRCDRKHHHAAFRNNSATDETMYRPIIGLTNAGYLRKVRIGCISMVD